MFWRISTKSGRKALRRNGKTSVVISFFSLPHTHQMDTRKREEEEKEKKGLPITSFYDLEFFC
jgi:hypothetical protein